MMALSYIHWRLSHFACVESLLYRLSFHETYLLLAFFRYDWVAKKSLFNGYFLWTSVGYGLGKFLHIPGAGIISASVEKSITSCFMYHLAR